MTREVVVVIGSGWGAGGSAVLAGDPSVLETLIAEGASVSVLSYALERTVPGAAAQHDLAQVRPPALDRALRAVGVFRLRDRLSRAPLGRLLNSLGPVDQGRVVRRVALSDAVARNLLRSADVVIAADLAGVATAWTARRRGWVTEAFYDHRASALGAGISLPVAGGSPP
jgi:hypothetical protein